MIVLTVYNYENLHSGTKSSGWLRYWELEQTIEAKALLEEKAGILIAKEDECMLLKGKLEKITAALAEKERENERLGEILKSKEEQILSLQNEGNKRKMESAHDSQG